MAFKVNFSEQAAIDFSEILDYISNELYAPLASNRFYDAVSKQIGIIGDNPLIFPLHPDKKLNEQKLHFTVIGNYLMFYVVNSEDDIVDIVRIIYGKRNLSTVMNED
jgi:plasmid stabilization system protein ParE